MPFSVPILIPNIGRRLSKDGKLLGTFSVMNVRVKSQKGAFDPKVDFF